MVSRYSSSKTWRRGGTRQSAAFRHRLGSSSNRSACETIIEKLSPFVDGCSLVAESQDRRILLSLLYCSPNDKLNEGVGPGRERATQASKSKNRLAGICLLRSAFVERSSLVPFLPFPFFPLLFSLPNFLIRLSVTHVPGETVRISSNLPLYLTHLALQNTSPSPKHRFCPRSAPNL